MPNRRLNSRLRWLLAAGGVAAVLAGPALAGSNAVGTWVMDNGKVTVRIDNCGGGLCGTIVGLQKPFDKNGRPKRDKDNPDPALRDRPVIGLTILQNLKPDGDGHWVGSIYNPDDGNTYDSDMKLVNGETIKVKGCVAFICKSMKFNRIE